jgi:hypothetical protein
MEYYDQVWKALNDDFYLDRSGSQASSQSKLITSEIWIL